MMPSGVSRKMIRILLTLNGLLQIQVERVSGEIPTIPPKNPSKDLAKMTALEFHYKPVEESQQVEMSRTNPINTVHQVSGFVALLQTTLLYR
jgi:hypothetical protein